jgi:hypothetical protein
MGRGSRSRLLDIADGLIASIFYNPLSGPDATTYREETREARKTSGVGRER